MVLQQKPLEKADFIVKITGPVMVRLASSDKWKAPYINKKSFSKLFLSKKKKKILLSGESRGGARGARLLLFSTKMRPEERKNFFERPPPLIGRSGSATAASKTILFITTVNQNGRFFTWLQIKNNPNH